MPGFANTRRKLIRLASKTLSGGDRVTFDLPKTGILAGIYLQMSGTLVNTTISQPNAYGLASIIKQVKLSLNTGIDVISLSGPGYHYLMRDFIEHYVDPVPHTNARSAVTIDVAWDCSMYLPVALNARDPVGMIMLQNEQTLATLSVEAEALATIGVNVTDIGATITPILEVFTVPLRAEDQPPFNMLHQILEEKQTLTATSGDFDYPWPRGNTYVQVLHGYGIKQSPANNFSQARLIVNQSETLMDFDPLAADLEFNRFHGRDRLLGVIAFDLFGSSGLGSYGSARDFFDSALVTDVLTRITLTAADDLYTIRRQLVDLGGE